LIREGIREVAGDGIRFIGLKNQLEHSERYFVLRLVEAFDSVEEIEDGNLC
jgi:hypothetical protein